MHSQYFTATFLFALNLPLFSFAAPSYNPKHILSGRDISQARIQVVKAITDFSADIAAVTSGLNAIRETNDPQQLEDLVFAVFNAEKDEDIHREIFAKVALQFGKPEVKEVARVANLTIVTNVVGPKAPTLGSDSFFGRLERLNSTVALANGGGDDGMLAQKIAANRNQFILPNIAKLMDAALAATGQGALTPEQRSFTVGSNAA
ncbi:hypothetical protein BJ875DRAFT_438932 [Amylocarpus encephaloides]|uniref:Uncharacterized protein n=1 Tax=Amylocarpus encephaloides TaxID=45428 RepID=A0A9P7YNR4_9HELO|nr:hypothetical protein BJ875DRAFT_438932 [Amylocarpus encephaloides]